MLAEEKGSARVGVEFQAHVPDECTYDSEERGDALVRSGE